MGQEFHFLLGYEFHQKDGPIGFDMYTSILTELFLVRVGSSLSDPGDSGFAWTMLFLNHIFYFIGDLGPLFIVLALTGLELGVAISQAHVSTISICIYLNDATNLHQKK